MEYLRDHGSYADFPFDEMTLFEGMETDERLLAEPRLIRDAYLRRLRLHLAKLRDACLTSRIDHVLVDTREDPGRLLAQFLMARELQGRATRRER